MWIVTHSIAVSRLIRSTKQSHRHNSYQSRFSTLTALSFPVVLFSAPVAFVRFISLISLEQFAPSDSRDLNCPSVAANGNACRDGVGACVVVAGASGGDALAGRAAVVGESRHEVGSRFCCELELGLFFIGDGRLAD